MNALEMLTCESLATELGNERRKYDNCLERWKNDPDNEGTEIIRRFGTWMVTSFGVECIADKDLNYHVYFIEKARLRQQDWPLHLEEKTWVNIWDFLRALYAARHHFWPRRYPSLEKLGLARPEITHGESL